MCDIQQKRWVNSFYMSDRLWLLLTSSVHLFCCDTPPPRWCIAVWGWVVLKCFECTSHLRSRWHQAQLKWSDVLDRLPRIINYHVLTMSVESSWLWFCTDEHRILMKSNKIKALAWNLIKEPTLSNHYLLKEKLYSSQILCLSLILHMTHTNRFLISFFFLSFSLCA